MEGQCDCANIQGEEGNPGLLELQRHQYDISYHDDLVNNNRQKTEGGNKHREEQLGFMPGRGTTDAMFAARQVIGKYREMQKELHMVLIDLDKAYERVPRQEVWRCLREQGVPEKYVCLVKDTYEDAQSHVNAIWRKFAPLHLFMFCFPSYSPIYDCLPTV